MSISTTQFFDFLDVTQSFSIDHQEVSSQIFSSLRQHVRSMIMSFRESENHEAQEIADLLRAALSSWLTAPIKFDKSIYSIFDVLGSSDEVERRWGRDVCSDLKLARQYAIELRASENPLRTRFSQKLIELLQNNWSFKIYCHKRTREHYESLLLALQLDAHSSNIFLHSIIDYRNADPFDVLIKIGPLRSRGWGSAPDALLTSPRYKTLLQIVWSGCMDEPGFGYDPTYSATQNNNITTKEGLSDIGPENHRINWIIQNERYSSDGSSSTIFQDFDDLKLLSESNEKREVIPAVFVQIDARHGILYPRLSHVLSFDPDALEPLNHRLPGETLSERMLIILPVLDDTSLSDSIAEEGYYSRIWKEKLKELYQNNRDNLINRLRAGGIDLINLGSRIEHWCKPATTVIPAPKLSSHFKTLIEVLEIIFPEESERPYQRAIWLYAWDEIRRSRGEAIQSGFQEQHVIDQQMLDFLRSIETELRTQWSIKSSFQIRIPEGKDFVGVFHIHTVLSIERGYHVPPSNLGTILEVDLVDQWQR